MTCALQPWGSSQPCDAIFTLTKKELPGLQTPAAVLLLLLLLQQQLLLLLHHQWAQNPPAGQLAHKKVVQSLIAASDAHLSTGDSHLSLTVDMYSALMCVVARTHREQQGPKKQAGKQAVFAACQLCHRTPSSPTSTCPM
jgi:hypothetical protein